jgi:hypothetical protein
METFFALVIAIRLGAEQVGPVVIAASEESCKHMSDPSARGADPTSRFPVGRSRRMAVGLLERAASIRV